MNTNIYKGTNLNVPAESTDIDYLLSQTRKAIGDYYLSMDKYSRRQATLYLIRATKRLPPCKLKNEATRLVILSRRDSVEKHVKKYNAKQGGFVKNW